MKVRHRHVEELEEDRACDDAHGCREPGDRTVLFSHLEPRNDEAPDRGGNHDPGGKAEGKGFSERRILFRTEEEDDGGADRRAEEGEARAERGPFKGFEKERIHGNTLTIENLFSIVYRNR